MKTRILISLIFITVYLILLRTSTFALTTTPIPPTPTLTPTPAPDVPASLVNLPSSCYTKQFGDADCNGTINSSDFDIWKISLTNNNVSRIYADFFPEGKISLADFEIWRRYSNGQPIPEPTNTPTPTAGPTITPSPTPLPFTWNITSNAICSNGFQPQIVSRTFAIKWPNAPTPAWAPLFTIYDPPQNDPDNNPQWSNGTTHTQTITSTDPNNNMYFGLQTNVKDPATNDFLAFQPVSVSQNSSEFTLAKYFNPQTYMAHWYRSLPGGNYTVNFDIPPQFCTTGTIAGHVNIGPLCAGPATEPNTCAITPDFTNRHFYVFASPGNNYITRIDISPGGNYSVNLPPGNYILNTSLILPTPPARTFERTNPAMPYPFTIVSGQTLTLNVDIDTGIR